MADNNATQLHAQQNVNSHLDPGARLALIPCAHPDGLLGAYEVVIPFNHIKRMAAAIIQMEGNNEMAALAKKAAEGLRLVKPT